MKSDKKNNQQKEISPTEGTRTRDPLAHTLGSPISQKLKAAIYTQKTRDG